MRLMLTRFVALPLFALLLCLVVACEEKFEVDEESAAHPKTRIKDTPFYQESRAEFLRHDVEGILTGIQQPPNELYAVAAAQQVVIIGGKDGVRRYSRGEWDTLLTGTWISSLLVQDDKVIAGGVDEVVIIRDQTKTYHDLPGAGRVRALAYGGGILYAGTENGLYSLIDGGFEAHPELSNRRVNDLLYEKGTGLWAATEHGCYLLTEDAVYRLGEDDYLLQENVTALALDGDGNLWIGTSLGLNMRQPDGKMLAFTGKQGLPVAGITGLAWVGDGNSAGLWLATNRGAVRHHEDRWDYFAGRRWLPHDHVRDVAVEQEGGIWLATRNGASRIGFQSWTLAQKAQHYLDINRQRHDRFGLVAECLLDLPGELETFRPRDSDNDGLWTGMFLAALSFQYAVTGNEEIRELADEHFAAMAFLEEVTGIAGLPARSIAELYSKSADPACYPYCQWQANPAAGFDWKSDTSSDEITGHFFAYSIYYDLAAEGEQRQKVVELVWRMADHIFSNDYFLIDWDGEHTTWGVWNPEFLWQWYKLADSEEAARYIGLIYANSLEILSFMRTAYHVTGDEQFLLAYQNLINQYALDDLMLNASIYFPMVTNHSTDELLFLAYYPLLRYESDQVRREKYLDSLRRTWEYNRIEHASLFNIIYGALSERGEDFDLAAAIDNMRDTPLDLVDWRMENSHRLDVVVDPFPNRFGETVSSRHMPPVPPDERRIMKWNGDPFVLDGGGAGTEEEAGTFWLLPYWMARYHGYITD